MTVIYLRHGESEGNALRVIQGWLEFPLTAAGELQAEAAARRLATSGAEALYSSPIGRARQTAAAVGAVLGLAPIETPGLREYGFGEAEGLRWEEAAARWGLQARDWGVGSVPGEEGMEAFRRRVGETFDALHQRHRESVAIAVVHGGVLGAIVGTLCGLEPHEHVQAFTGNCGITVVSEERGRPVITALNDRCHLASATD